MLHPVEVRSLSSGYAGVFASARFRKGDVLLPIVGEMQSRPSRYSLQVAAQAHVAPAFNGARPAHGERGVWYFLNHRCTPNTCVDVEALVVVAQETIECGEELTFNYNATEWDMATPFQCCCGALNCYGHVRGFKHLTAEQQRALLPHAAPHIRRLYSEPGRVG